MDLPRGFPDTEYKARVSRAQEMMARHDLAALFLTTEPDIRYFTGYLTKFWESPTRPWFLVLPASGDPVAVIPSIGAALMGRTWIKDIRTWRAPDYEDDGVSLLAATLAELAGGGNIGVPMGLESQLRMPLGDWMRLQAMSGLRFVPDQRVMWDLRAVKSEAEIDKIRTICAVGDRVFARVPEIARAGVSLERVFRDFQRLGLEEGADWVPYVAGASGAGGYSDVISPAGPEPLQRGDVLMLDTGMQRDGYFCDFDRNFSVGPAGQTENAAQAKLIDAVDAAAEIARPGTTAAELFHVMDRLLTGGRGSDAGRLGHGLGMQLTEGLSLIPQDQTELQPGMVITLEPGVELSPGRIMVHEEDIVIRDGAPEFLATRAGRTLIELEG